MPEIEYYYFSIKGLGEGNRLLLAYGGEPWEDKQITLEQWKDFKPKTKFGQLPMLTIDGKQRSQSIAIARFLGRRYGLAGANSDEDFEIDEIIETVVDLRLKSVAVHYEKDQAIADKKHEEFVQNYYFQSMDKLNEIIVKNNGHLALGKLTWADFVFTGTYECLKATLRMPDLDSKYPNFKNLFDSVYAIPSVKAYGEESPKKCVYTAEDLKVFR